MDQTIDYDEHDGMDDKVTTTMAQHLQVVEREALHIESTTRTATQELDNIFDKNEEVKRMCVVYFFVIGQDANPDKATWIGRNGTIDKIKKGIEGHPQAQFEYILQDALDH